MKNEHPYYDSEKKWKMMKVRYQFLAMVVILFLFSLFIPKVMKWKNRNMVKEWVQYEVVYRDSTQVILYNSDNVKDSIVIRGAPKLFPGIQAVEILHYKLP